MIKEVFCCYNFDHLFWEKNYFFKNMRQKIIGKSGSLETFLSSFLHVALYSTAAYNRAKDSLGSHLKSYNSNVYSIQNFNFRFSIKVCLFGNQYSFHDFRFWKNIFGNFIFRSALFSKNLQDGLIWKKNTVEKKKPVDHSAFTDKSKSFNF